METIPARCLTKKISRAGQEGLEKRRRSTASAAAHGWAKAPEVSHQGAPETSGDGFSVKRGSVAATLPTGPRWLWPGAASHLANSRLMGAHGLSASFTIDAGYEAFAVSALMLLEAQRFALPALATRTSPRNGTNLMSEKERRNGMWRSVRCMRCWAHFISHTRHRQKTRLAKSRPALNEKT